MRRVWRLLVDLWLYSTGRRPHPSRGEPYAIRWEAKAKAEQ